MPTVGNRSSHWVAWTFAAIGAIAGCAGSGSGQFGSKEILGRALFNDVTLSEPSGQSCASCHQGATAFADPRQDKPTSEGATTGLFGPRQAPTLTYVSFAPPFHFDAVAGDYVGGQFWDGRAVNLADQAHFPMLNPAEMNNPSRERIVQKVASGPMAAMMKAVYGDAVFGDTDRAMNAISDAIAAFESSGPFHPFSSKYDLYLAGKATLTAAEARGLAVFNGKAGCNGCHPSAPGPNGEPPLFTDFTYDNIGLPKNLASAFFSMPPAINPAGAGFIDVGLMATTHRPEDKGRFKVPSLRNIAISGPYFHNGFATTLEQAVRFYNERDLGHFGPAEVSETMNKVELGNLGLTDQEVSDVVAFMKTLTDGSR